MATTIGQNSQIQQPSKYDRAVQAEKDGVGKIITNGVIGAGVGAGAGLIIGAGVGAAAGGILTANPVGAGAGGIGGAILFGIPWAITLGASGAAVGAVGTAAKIAYDA